MNKQTTKEKLLKLERLERENYNRERNKAEKTVLLGDIYIFGGFAVCWFLGIGLPSPTSMIIPLAYLLGFILLGVQQKNEEKLKQIKTDWRSD